MDRPAERVALIEWLDRDGAVLRAIDVPAWPITLGRSLDNLVVLDDPHVAAAHARLERAEDGTVLLRLGDTLNGALLGPQRLAAGQQAALNSQQGEFQLGLTRLRLRLPGQPLAAEQALPRAEAPWAHSLWLLLALAALVAWPAWLAMDPGADESDWLPIVLGTPAALALWCALWALASKLFRHRFDFLGHLGVMLRVLVPMLALALVLPPLAAALDWPALWQATQWAAPVTLALLAWRHGLRVLPGHARVVSAGVLALLLLGTATAMTLTHQRFERLQRAPYMSSLAGPGWRWHAPVDSAQFLTEARALEPALKAAATAARAQDDEDEALP